MNVELIDYMGSDLTVVNAARVSFAKESEFEVTKNTLTDGFISYLSKKDQKLIMYLAEHNHWSPFGHATLQFRIKAPVFVARQLVKHQVGLVWNEVSDDKKQGSSDETIEYNIDGAIQFVTQTYQNLLNNNIAPEMARMVLPQNMYTEWFWSGTLMAFARVCNLRCAKDTQWETQQIADLIDEQVSKLFPVSWSALRDE